MTLAMTDALNTRAESRLKIATEIAAHSICLAMGCTRNPTSHNTIGINMTASLQ